MTEQSPRMSWSYPSRDDDPWYDSFKDFVIASDGSSYAHREDRSIIWSGGGTVSWDLGSETFTWTDTINIYSPISGKLLQVAAGSVIGWASGEVVYVSLTRQVLTNTAKTFSKSTALPSNDDVVAFGVRIGDVVFLRTGISLGDGDSSSSGVAPVPGGGSGTDPDAIHDNVAGEISAIAPKGSPTSSDYLIIEDAADLNNKKSITIGDLPTGSSVDIQTHTIVVGNFVAGDTSNDCDYLDTGNGAQLDAALTAAAINDDDVFIRRGTYDLGAPGAPTKFTIPSGVRVVGAGKRQVTLKARAAGGNGSVMDLGTNSSVEQVYVFAPIPTAAQTFADGVVNVYGNNCILRDMIVEFENGWATIGDPAYKNLDAGIFTDNYTNVKLYDIDVIDTPILDDLGGTATSGIFLYFTDQVYIRGVQVSGGEYGIQAANYDYGDIQNVRITGWQLNGIMMNTCHYVNTSGVTIISDGSSPTKAVGIQLIGGCDFLSFSGGYLSGGGAAGVDLFSSCSNCTFTGLKGDGLWNFYGFLQAGSGCNSNIFTGNQLNGDGYVDSGTANDFAHNRA